jgi:hypothetical protein
MKHAVDPPNVIMDRKLAAWWDFSVTIRYRLSMNFTKTTAFKIRTARIATVGGIQWWNKSLCRSWKRESKKEERPAVVE